jgi:hypothetical protein
MNATRKTFVIALIFVFALVAVLPAFQTPGLAATCQATYTVKRGDTLSRIGQKWGVAWREIAAANNIKAPWRIYTGSKLCIPTGTTTTPVTPKPPKTGRIPTFSISAVVRDNNVTIQTANFPANTKFDVRMGAFGTAGVGGTLVTTIDSGAGGSFSATYSIPASLQGSRRIAIRLESSKTGYFAYNWFWNSNAQ